MVNLFVKHIFIIYNCFFIFDRIQNSTQHLKQIVKNLLFSTLLSISIIAINKYFPSERTFILFFLILIVNVLFNRNRSKTTFTASALSFGLSYFTFIMSIFALVPVILLLFCVIKERAVCYPLCFAIVGIFQSILSIHIFKIQRFKRGMTFLSDNNSNTVGLVLSFSIILIVTIWTVNSKKDLLLALSILWATLMGILVFVWWRKRLSQSYIEKIRKREIESLQIEIEQLKNENEQLSKIIHKDNKLIPSMIMTVNAALNLNSNSSEELSKLIVELDTLAKERAGTLAAYENSNANIPPTGCLRVDAIIQYMYKKMTSHEINFLVINNVDLKHLVSTVIDENSLSTLVADLVENAMIATKNQPTKHVLLNFCIIKGVFRIIISDSGEPFSPTVYRNLGIKRYTTHKKTGGSGIGLMTTVELIKKLSASLIIEELDNETYSKNVIVSFDGLAQIQIISKRADVCKLSTHRKDILFTLNT